MSKSNGTFQIQKVDPTTIDWHRSGKYNKVIQALCQLKIGDAIAIHPISQGGAHYSNSEARRRVKGVYRLRCRYVADYQKAYFYKTDK